MTPFTDSQKAELAEARKAARQQLIRWNPDFNMGSVVSLCIMLGGLYLFFSTGQRIDDKQDMRLDALEASSKDRNAQVERSLDELQAQVGKLNESMSQLRLDLQAATLLSRAKTERGP